MNVTTSRGQYVQTVTQIPVTAFFGKIEVSFGFFVLSGKNQL